MIACEVLGGAMIWRWFWLGLVDFPRRTTSLCNEIWTMLSTHVLYATDEMLQALRIHRSRDGQLITGLNRPQSRATSPLYTHNSYASTKYIRVLRCIQMLFSPSALTDDGRIGCSCFARTYDMHMYEDSPVLQECNDAMFRTGVDGCIFARMIILRLFLISSTSFVVFKNECRPSLTF